MRTKSRVTQVKLNRRRRRIRRKIHGTAQRPRLNVRRTLKHVTASLVNDDAGKTLVQVSSTSKSLSVPEDAGSVKMGRSQVVGMEIARRAKEKGISSVAFDRGGRLYHGRVKALAEAARKGGLEF